MVAISKKVSAMLRRPRKMSYPTHRGSRVGSRPKIQERCGLLVYADGMVVFRIGGRRGLLADG